MAIYPRASAGDRTRLTGRLALLFLDRELARGGAARSLTFRAASGYFFKRTLHEQNVAAISSDPALENIVVARELFSETARNRPINSCSTHKNYLSSR